MQYCPILVKEKSFKWIILLLLSSIFTLVFCVNYIPIESINQLCIKATFIANTIKNELNLDFLGIGLVIFLLLLLLKFYKTKLVLLKAIKSRERFFALFSHDLRGVITNLKDSGEVLNYLIKNDRLDEIQEVSKQLDWDGSNALLLLNNMLDWGTLTGYSYQPTFRNFLLSDKVWDIISTYESAIDSKSIKLSVEIENGLSIYSDEKSIDVVLRNIIANAKSHAPAGGNISIRLEKHQANQIAFIVTNSVSVLKRYNFKHIQNVLAGKTKPNIGRHGLGLGIVLIHEYAKNCDFNLELFFENNIVTFKAVL
jgi:signal transduction histidine kinase